MQKLLLIVCMLCCKANRVPAQDTVYRDSVKAMVRQIDSLIMTASSDPQPGVAIAKTGIHFSNLQQETCGSVELYKEDSTGTLYRLSYSNGCDSIHTLQDYYFRDNKIIFIRTVRFSDSGKPVDEYYAGDKPAYPLPGRSSLEDGYELLKKISH